MSNTNQFRKQIISWSNRFPLDGAFRKKYNIAFGSAEHREINQIDVYFEWLEEELHREFLDKAREEIRNEAEFKKGVWIKESIELEEDEIALFNKLSVKSINDASALAIEEENEQ